MESADVPHAVPPPLPGSAPAPTLAVRFCRACGAPWDPTSEVCSNCVDKPKNNGSSGRSELERRSILSAVWLYFALLSISLCMIFYVIVATPRSLLGVEAVGSGVMSVLIAGWAIANPSLMRNAFRVPKIRWLLLAILLGLATHTVASISMGWLQKWLGLPTMDAAENFRNIPYGVLVGILMICVQPAFFEELGFRGVILPSLGRVLSTNEAITVTALMFGILHLSIPSLPHLVLIGWLAGWVRCRSGSLYPAVLLHFTHNFLTLSHDWSWGKLPW